MTKLPMKIWLKFIPLEFETGAEMGKNFSGNTLKFIPLEFETGDIKPQITFSSRVKIYSVGI